MSRIDDLQNNIDEIKELISDLEDELLSLRDDLIEEQESGIRRFKPKKGETYYYIDSIGGIVSSCWNNGAADIVKYGYGNCFETSDDAAFELERLRVIAEMKEFAESEGKDWYSGKPHYRLCYNYKDRRFTYPSTSREQSGEIYFKSIEKIEECIEDIGEERIKKYYLRWRD